MSKPIQLPVGNKGYAHYACPKCGNVHTLPDNPDPPYCLHGGSSGYAWPETHWQGGEERDPEWRERWERNGWTETVKANVYFTPLGDEQVPNTLAQVWKDGNMAGFAEGQADASGDEDFVPAKNPHLRRG